MGEGVEVELIVPILSGLVACPLIISKPKHDILFGPLALGGLNGWSSTPPVRHQLVGVGHPPRLTPILILFILCKALTSIVTIHGLAYEGGRLSLRRPLSITPNAVVTVGA